MSHKSYQKLLGRLNGFTKMGHNLRKTSSQAAGDVFRNLAGDALAVNPGSAPGDMMPAESDRVNQQTNLGGHKGKERTVPVVMWSGHQEYLMKTSPTNIVLMGDYGTGELII